MLLFCSAQTLHWAKINPYRKGSSFSFPPPACLRVCATCWLLFYIPLSSSDELKHIIGADTTRKGILRVFDMFQYQPMNRRLVYVFLEGFLETMFPQYKFPELFVKLHSRSPRIHRYNQRLKSSSLKRWQERTEARGHGITRHTQTWELRVRLGGLDVNVGVCVFFLLLFFALPLPSHTPVIQLIFFFFFSIQNWRMNNTHSALPPLYDTHTHTNPVICTKTEHGSFFFLVWVFSSSYFLLVFSFILG